jgi:hypothetical protein
MPDGGASMPLFLRSEDPPTLAGLTLFSDNRLGHWLQTLGVYVPPSVDFDTGVVNVVIWLHGYFVPKIEHLFSGDRSAVRQQVLASGKPVVLIAPYLGHGHRDKSKPFTFSTDLTGHWGERCLNQVLGTLALMRDPDTYDAPWKNSTLTLTGLAKAADVSPGLRLDKLVIACHSGGGAAMRNLVGSLGRYRAKLAECWGFDCLYGVKIEPDDANFWYGWTTGSTGRPLHISFGSSTVFESVKMHLMGRGLASGAGDRRDPRGGEVKALNVKLGITSARTVDELMGLDPLLKAPAPKNGRPPPAGQKFVDQAATNLSKNAGWPSDRDAMHYQIARDGLLDRLKAADFL